MRARLLVSVFAVCAACDGKSKTTRSAETPVPTQAPSEPIAEPTPAKLDEPPEPPAVDGRDFIDELKFLYRVTARGGEGEIEAPISQKAIDRHCKHLAGYEKKYRDRWLSKATPFFADLVPKDLPKTVVYPFAGADLLTVLAVFPDFDEATTLSLEPSGDPRSVKTMKPGSFRGALNGVRVQLHNLFVMNHNLTLKMITHFRGGGLPGHLIFTLKALELHGLEPVAAYYFTLKPDGAIDYLTAEEIAAFPEKESARDRNARFGSIEIRFRKPGDSRIRIYRHILANLDNKNLAAAPGSLAHLKAKGKVAMITKAASFLLWWESFSTIRNYMLENMAWMVSDSTGIPPSMAEPAGFELVTWGRFNGAILNPAQKYIREFRKLWRGQEKRRLEFRFGYPDSASQHHLMVTRPRAK